MSSRMIEMTDDQIRLISQGLILLHGHPNALSAEQLAEVDLLIGCAESTVKEPEDPKMVHGWCY